MSVHKRKLPSGSVQYVVRWREGSANRSRSFDDKKIADAYDKRIRALRQAGELAEQLEQRRTTIADLVAEWWERDAPNLAAATIDHYAVLLDQRVIPQLGARRAQQLTVADVERWIGWMRGQGTGDPTILKACAVLQAVLTLGVRDGLLSVNVVAAARKPRQQRTRVPYLVTPDQVEAMRAHMLGRGQERDVVLLELLGYAGLRPLSEAVALQWRHVRDRSLFVIDTKRHRERTIPMLPVLRETLNVWRLRCGRPGPDALVIPSPGGDAWSADQWRGWRRNQFARAAAASALPADLRPRDLRGSFVSLLVHEGRSIVEVARQLGHSPEVCLRDYAQVFDDTDPANRVPADDAVRAARARALQNRDEEATG